jgi:hypothetical protein
MKSQISAEMPDTEFSDQFPALGYGAARVAERPRMRETNKPTGLER